MLSIYLCVKQYIASCLAHTAVWTQEDRCCNPDVWEGKLHMCTGFIEDGMPKMAAVGY